MQSEEESFRRCACGAVIAAGRATACAACSRASSARYYQRHRTRVLGRLALKKGLLTAAQVQARRDRAYLAQYVKRGKVVPDPCQRCGHDQVVPIQPTLGRPLLVAWACRACKPRVTADLEGGVISASPPIRQPRRERAAAQVPRPWGEPFEQVERELQSWPAEMAEAIRRAASSLHGVPVARDTRLYKMLLLAVYKRARDAGAPGGGAGAQTS